MGELRTNQAKLNLANGGIATVINGSPMSPDIVDMLGPLGFDAIWIEAEHGDVDYGDIPNLTRACDLWGMTSLVRVNRAEPGIIYRTLDVGAMGIVVPHVNTANEAEEIAKAAKFYPLGNRGYFSSRQSYGVDDFVHNANQQSMVVVMIEDVLAVKNLDEILAVDNIDVYFVAPGDLGQSMGILDMNDPRVTQTVDDVITRIVSAGKVAGGTGGAARATEYLDMGARFICTNWSSWIDAEANTFLEAVRKR